MANGRLDHIDLALGEFQSQKIVHAELGVLLKVKIGRLRYIIEQEKCSGFMLLNFIE